MKSMFLLRRFKPWFCFVCFFVFAAIFNASIAQTPYFQQEINYKIIVELDDKTNTLNGNIEIEYHNNAPDSLREIWMHLWGNAFKNRRTAYCKQELESGNSKFYFASEEDLGYYKNLDFTVDGQKAEWHFDKNNPDIALLKLPKALAPGGHLAIATPFVLKIPASFSRLGHVGESYQITQWFPKPAVYDNKGWHNMPYLNQGEFYSEFGAFDVTITLPDNYVVGATGVLQTPSEITFLQQKEAETKKKLGQKIEEEKEVPFPASSATLKTIRYKAEKVHDFAWFADKRFNVLKDTAHLASGRTVDCWALFTDEDFKLWEAAAFYVRRSVEYYSTHVGEYPYPHATAVHSALSAGGGMEYPMITVINNGGTAKSLDEVITHEVGHNWFYGILASNERDHPFLDEGFNSYYEQRYMKDFYGSGDLADNLGLPKKLFNPIEQGSLVENGYLMLARENKDTPPDSYSDDFTLIGYGLQVYMKTAVCLAWLEGSVGKEKLDAAFQDYYRRWQFKHPYPDDWRASFKQSGVGPDWIFDEMNTRKKTDYALLDVKKSSGKTGTYELTIENKKELDTPFAVTALKAGKPVATEWFTVPKSSKFQVSFPTDSADAFAIDYDHATLDLNRNNNYRRTKGLFPSVEPLAYKTLAFVQNPTKTTLAVIPWVGWNNYDKTMLGLMVYDAPFPPRKFQYYLLPGFGLGSKRFTGMGDLRYKFYPGGLVPRIAAGVTAKAFDYEYNTSTDTALYSRSFAYYLKFRRIAPQVRIDLRSGDKNFNHFVNFRVLFINREKAMFRQDSTRPIDNHGVVSYPYLIYNGKAQQNNTIYEIRYEGFQKRLPNPFHYTATIETQDYRDRLDRPANYVKGSIEWQQQFYFKSKRKVNARFFAGYFLQTTQRHRGVDETAFALNPQGFNDYRFDQLYFGRTETSGIMARQVSQTEGGFKSAFGAPYRDVIGNSNNYIVSLNLKSDLPQRLPFGLPIKPWFDIGYYDDATPIGQDLPKKDNLLWSGGLMLDVFKGSLEVYFPLVNAKALKERYAVQSGGTNSSALFGGGNYLKWISFSIHLNSFEPTEIVESLVR